MVVLGISQQNAVPVDLAVWSRAMDLVAVVTAEDLTVRRLNYQQLWKKSLDAKIVAAAWRPDGELLVVVNDQQLVEIFATENAKLVHKFQASGPVSYLGWNRFFSETVAFGDWLNPSLQSGEAFLAHVPIIYAEPEEDTHSEAAKPSIMGGSTEPDDSLHAARERARSLLVSKRDDLPTNCSMLIIGYAAGHCEFYLGGSVLCGQTPIPPTDGDNLSVQLASFDVLLNELVVCRGNRQQTKFTIYKTQQLHRNATKLRELWMRFAVMSSLLDTLKVATQQTGDAWEESLLRFDVQMSKFAEKLQQKTVSSELLCLLTCGIASPELQHFLIHDLTESNLKRLRGALDSSYAHMTESGGQTMQSAEEFVFHAGQLFAMSRFNDTMTAIGIDEETTDSLLKVAGSFALKCTEVLTILKSAKTGFQALLTWLHASVNRLAETNQAQSATEIQTPAEVKLVADFLTYSATWDLKKAEDVSSDDPFGLNSSVHSNDVVEPVDARQFNSQRVSQYFVDAPLRYPYQPPVPVPVAGINSSNSTHRYPHDVKASLVQVLNRLKEQFGRLLEKFSGTLASNITVQSECTLSAADASSLHAHDVWSNTAANNRTQVEDPSDMWVSLVDATQRHLVLLHRDQAGWNGTLIKAEDDRKILNALHLGGDQAVEAVVLLVQTINTAELQQLPVDDLKWRSVKIGATKLDLSTALAKAKCCVDGVESVKRRAIQAHDAAFLSISSTRKVGCVVSKGRRRMETFDFGIDPDLEEEAAERANENSSAMNTSV